MKKMLMAILVFALMTCSASADQPNVPLLKINRSDETTYQVIVRKELPLATSLQVAVDGDNVSNFAFAETIPAAWDSKMQAATATGRTFMIGNSSPAGEVFPAGVIATFSCDDAPVIRWDGDSPTGLLLAAAGGFDPVSLEDPAPQVDGFEGTPYNPNQVDPGDPGNPDPVDPDNQNSGSGGGGCSAVPATAILSLLAPVVFVKRKEK